MKIHFLTLVSQVILIACSTFIFTANSWDLTTLQLVQMIYRHGEKNPALTYPLDPYKNESFWPGGFSQITNKGKKTMYNLGLYLRQRYDGFINVNYTDEEVYAISSDTDRSIISAMSCLAGLYKDTNLKATWNPDIQWEPIPVHVLMKEHDRFIHLTEHCSYLDEHQKTLFTDSEFQRQFDKENAELNEYGANHSGLSPPGLFTTGVLHVILEAQANNDVHPMPEWTNVLLSSKTFLAVATTVVKKLNEDDKWVRLRTGPILGEMTAHMEAKVLNNTDVKTKMWMYSGHDRSLLDTMMGLGIDFDGDIIPPYASTLILELHQDPTSLEFYVEILYRNDTNSNVPHILKIPSCEDPCTFKTFQQIVNKLQYANWTKECEMSTTQTQITFHNNDSSALHTTGFFICLLVSALALIYAYNRKKNMKREDYFVM